MKTPAITTLNTPDVINTASRLTHEGRLAISDNQLIFLNIDDAYIHQLFPLLKNEATQKPDYFREKSAGAHISVIYPEENTIIDKKEIGQQHVFTIKEMVTAVIGEKTYYALLVESPSLLALRRRYMVPDLLNFKGYAIGFHITIGVSKPQEKI